MKNKHRLLGFFLGLITLFTVACEDDIAPLVEELDLDRVLSPTELTAFIRNRTTVELEWELTEADSYVIEIYEDSLEFNTEIVRTQTVTQEEVPVQIALIGETGYSARIKGVQEGVDDSKWSSVYFETLSEQILLDIDPMDIASNSVTLNWPAGSEVTHFVVEPGDTQVNITADEIAAGEATVSGLTGETEYTIKLFKDEKQRGQQIATTYLDLNTVNAVLGPGDDLQAAINAANPGDVIALTPGTYVTTGQIDITKPISIKGSLPYDKPILDVGFNIAALSALMTTSVELATLEMVGTYDASSSFISLEATGFDYGDIVVKGCEIHDYGKSLFTASSSVVSTINSLTFDDCIATNVLTSGGDCIDVRGGYLVSLTLQNSTFDFCAPGREFIRLDDTSSTFEGVNTDILIDQCTFNEVSGISGDRMLYVRFQTNEITVRNTLIANSEGNYSNQSRTDQAPDFSDNNYFNAALFHDSGETVFDGSTSLTTLDPGFADAENGDFTISNQSLIDNQVGDPRWR